ILQRVLRCAGLRSPAVQLVIRREQGELCCLESILGDFRYPRADAARRYRRVLYPVIQPACIREGLVAVVVERVAVILEYRASAVKPVKECRRRIEVDRIRASHDRVRPWHDWIGLRHTARTRRAARTAAAARIPIRQALIRHTADAI